MKFNYKKQLAAAFMTAVLAAPLMATTVATANNNASGSPEEQADITNWIANTPQQVSNNMAMQHIDMNNLNGTRYIIQWGDTLSSISAATGISVAKLCYDNNIQNANLIYAGDVLILNRDGDVPAGYVPNVNPYAVAQTKVTINNGPQNVKITVMPQKVVKTYNKYVDNSTTNNDNSTTNNAFTAPNDSSSSTTEGNGDQSDNSSEGSSEAKTSTKNTTTSSHSKKHSSSVTASDLVSGLEGAQDSDSKLSFEEGDGGDDAELVSVDSKAILKDAKKGDYDAALEEIEKGLGDKADKDATVYIELDDGDLSVYVSTNDDDSSSEDSNKDDDDNDSSSQDQDQDNDDDSNNQATNDNQDTDTNDDDNDF
ncbi:LysM peptidoglycan-binding domain-containing protein [Limosilactobacillus viscerum]|uniref:LysM peptidoglycan-binding domain-containing protein n=1 Tax=Limosilactobacillus viscerum TaxID=2993450 RepID=UPI0024B89E4B|nr:LysM domain-containing protein [Limosilactobacillus viscerum]